MNIRVLFTFAEDRFKNKDYESAYQYYLDIYKEIKERNTQSMTAKQNLIKARLGVAKCMPILLFSSANKNTDQQPSFENIKACEIRTIHIFKKLSKMCQKLPPKSKKFIEKMQAKIINEQVNAYTNLAYTHWSIVKNLESIDQNPPIKEDFETKYNRYLLMLQHLNCYLGYTNEKAKLGFSNVSEQNIVFKYTAELYDLISDLYFDAVAIEKITNPQVKRKVCMALDEAIFYNEEAIELWNKMDSHQEDLSYLHLGRLNLLYEAFKHSQNFVYLTAMSHTLDSYFNQESEDQDIQREITGLRLFIEIYRENHRPELAKSWACKLLLLGKSKDKPALNFYYELAKNYCEFSETAECSPKKRKLEKPSLYADQCSRTPAMFQPLKNSSPEENLFVPKFQVE